MVFNPRPLAWLLSKLSPVPTLDFEKVKHSVPNDETKRRRTFEGDPERHRITKPALVVGKFRTGSDRQ